MKKIRRIAAAVLAVTMAVGMLAGCGKKNNSELNKIDKNTIYREEVLDISFPANFNVNNAVFSEKNGFFRGERGLRHGAGGHPGHALRPRQRGLRRLQRHSRPGGGGVFLRPAVAPACGDPRERGGRRADGGGL